MEVQPSDEWVLLLSNTLVDTKAKLASSEYERERMKLVIKKLQATLECKYPFSLLKQKNRPYGRNTVHATTPCICDTRSPRSFYAPSFPLARASSVLFLHPPGSEAKRALEIKQELEDSKRELRSTQGLLLGTRQQLQHQKHLVGRLKGQKASV